uniref:Uncharacterized protein n=1 Tax=Arundo donax TaxID=35708 RepID=A0A0A9CMZ7_ARUDO
MIDISFNKIDFLDVSPFKICMLIKCSYVLLMHIATLFIYAHVWTFSYAKHTALIYQ